MLYNIFHCGNRRWVLEKSLNFILLLATVLLNNCQHVSFNYLNIISPKLYIANNL